MSGTKQHTPGQLDKVWAIYARRTSTLLVHKVYSTRALAEHYAFDVIQFGRLEVTIHPLFVISNKHDPTESADPQGKR